MMKKLLKKHIFIVLFFITGTGSAFCQQITFQKNYGNSGDSDWSHTGFATKDSGYIICGECLDSLGQGSECLLKFDSFGQLIWTKIYKDVNGFGFGNFSLIEENNSQLVFGGGCYNTITSQGESKIEKRTKIGQLMWMKSYGDSSFSYGLWGIIESHSGSYIACGQRNSSILGFDSFILKTDTSGNLIWAKNYFGFLQNFRNIISTSDSGIVIIGNLSPDSSGIQDATMLMKLDSAGNPLWTKSYAINGGGSFGFYAQETPDKGIIAIGMQQGIFLFKTDSLGNEQWAKRYYGIAPTGRGLWLDQTTDGGFILAGTVAQLGPGGLPVDAFALIKTDINGNIQWVTSPSGYLKQKYVKQTFDGGYFIYGQIENADSSGSAQLDLYMIKTDSLGNTGGCNEFSISVTSSSIIDSVTSVLTLVNNLNLTTTIPTITLGNGGALTTICSPVGIQEAQKEKAEIEIYPNPVTDKLTITTNNNNLSEIILYDIASRKILQQKFTNTVTLNTAQLAKGMYVYEVRKSQDGLGGVMKLGKIIKE